MTRALPLPLALALALAGVTAAAPVGGARADDAAAARRRVNLLFLSPPVIGYSTIDGVVYQAAPLGYERALSSRAGVRFTPTAIVYGGAVQEYGVFVGLPVYLRACRDGAPYGGGYAAPLVGAWVDRLPVERREAGAGGEVGWSWALGDRWQLTAGAWALLPLGGADASSGGLSLTLGLWL